MMRRQRLRKQHSGFRLRLQTQRHMNFAQWIANRYARFSPGWQRLLMMQRHWPRALLHLSPRFNLSFVSALPEVIFRPDRSAVSTTVSPIRRVIDWLQSETYVKRIKRSIENETLVEHVASRRRRIELDAGGGPDKPNQKPTAKVLRQERGFATQKSGGAKTKVQESTISPDRGYQRESAIRPAATPTIDVNQLTDEVIRSIDRRIIARRERLGRI